MGLTGREQLLQLQRKDPTLTSLSFHLAQYNPPRPGRSYGTVIVMTEVEELGQNIGSNTYLTKLTFDGGGCDMRIQVDELREQFQILCEGANLNQPIRKVNFYNCWQVGGGIIQFLTQESNPNLQIICLDNGVILGCKGMRLLEAVLVQRQSPFVKLSLRLNSIDDDLLAGLIMPLLENPTLDPKELDLYCNYIEQNGYNSNAKLLKYPMCSIEKLNLDKMNEISSINLANALARNNTLK